MGRERTNTAVVQAPFLPQPNPMSLSSALKDTHADRASDRHQDYPNSSRSNRSPLGKQIAPIWIRMYPTLPQALRPIRLKSPFFVNVSTSVCLTDYENDVIKPRRSELRNHRPPSCLSSAKRAFPPAGLLTSGDYALTSVQQTHQCDQLGNLPSR